MGWLREWGRVAGGCLLAMLLVPGLATWPSSLLDRGPDGSVRVSAFPLALTLFDPFVWTCARNSLLVASATACLSTALGVGLGLVAGDRRFWGRAPLWALAIAPLAAGPLLIAPALASALGGDRGWEWLASRTVLGLSLESSSRWGALVWAGVSWGSPLVALATVAGLRRIDPAWTEASLAVGASGRRTWRDVTWPNLRPEVARASAVVFTLALVEPAGPLVLGLRRTLAAQLVEAATRLDQPTRSSTLALLAVGVALLGRSFIVWWGGKVTTSEHGPGSGPPPLAGFGRASLSLGLLAAWCGVALGPVAVWVWRGFREATASGISHPWLAGLADPEVVTWATNSAMTASLAVAVDLAVLRALAPRRPGRGGQAIGLACRVFEAVPPLALGAGALAVPWLLLALADSGDAAVSSGGRWLATELSPGRSPGWLVVLVLAAGPLPMLAGLTREEVRPSRVDASRLMGESDRRAYRAVAGGWLGVVPLSSAFLAFAMASTSLAPVLLLTPTVERQTLATGLLTFVKQPGPPGSKALGAVAILLGINLLAFAMATKGRTGVSGDGSRPG